MIIRMQKYEKETGGGYHICGNFAGRALIYLFWLSDIADELYFCGLIVES